VSAPGISGAAPLPSGALDTGLPAIAAGVGKVTDVIANIAIQRQEMRDKTAASELQFQYDSFNNNYAKLAAETEFENQKEFDDFRSKYSSDLQSMESGLLKDQNSRVQSRMTIAFNQSRANSINSMDTILLRQERESYRRRLPAQLSTMYEDFYTSPVAKSPEELEDKVDLFIARNAQWFDEGELEQQNVLIHAEVLGRLGKTEEAEELITQTHLLDAKAKTAMESRIDAMSKVNSEIASKELSDMFLRDEMTIKDVAVRRDRLSASDYKAWITAFKNSQSDGNPILASELLQEATNIWRGTVSRDDFNDMAMTALGRTDGINATEYKSVMSQATTQLKQSQAQAISHRVSEARRVLVETGGNAFLESNIFAALPADKKQAFLSKMQLQNWHVSQYTRELTEYVAQNPDVSGSDFYAYSESLLYEYMNRTEQDINERITKRQQEVRVGEIPEELPEDLSVYTNEQLLEAIQRE
jgi:hypothetical protein